MSSLLVPLNRGASHDISEAAYCGFNICHCVGGLSSVGSKCCGGQHGEMSDASRGTVYRLLRQNRSGSDRRRLRRRFHHVQLWCSWGWLSVSRCQPKLRTSQARSGHRTDSAPLTGSPTACEEWESTLGSFGRKPMATPRVADFILAALRTESALGALC